MNLEEIRIYCLSKGQVTESFPFDNETLVFKLDTKIFALLSLNGNSINLKCDPDKAIELRAEFYGVLPGYHMNKKHWNTIQLDADVHDEVLNELIDHSYSLVFHSFSKKRQSELTRM